MNNDPLRLLPVPLSKVRTQDVFVVATFIAAVVVFRAPDVWELQPSWQLDVVVDADHNNYGNLLPLPIITDLDSDGVNELIITTKDSRLKILTLPPQGDSDYSSTLPHLHVKAEVVLNSNTNLSKSALPVALGVGCVQEDVSDLDVCRQIVVAVTDDGVVRCFSDRLELLWMSDIFKDGKSAAYYKEIAVLVVPYLNDHGLVLIGGTASEAKQPVDDHLEHDHQHNFSARLSAEKIADLPPQRHRNTKLATEDLEHFSTYALNSKTGRLLWKHEPGDYGAKEISKEDLLSAYHFKLALHSSQYHVGEAHWSQYTESLSASLPHRWQHPSDTRIHTALFVKNSPTPRNQKLNGGFRTERKAVANRTKPNAAVIHHRKGIEVLDIDSGQPLCTYTNSKGAIAIGDVNGDGVIDHVATYFTSEHLIQAEVNPCSAVVTSGSRTLFSGSICRPTSTFGGYFDSISEEDYREEPFPVTPLLVRSPLGRREIFSYLSGVTFQRDRMRTLDSVFLIATGRLTSFGPYGEFNWQVDAFASRKKSSSQQNAPVEDTNKVRFVHNVQSTSTLVGQTEDAVLVADRKGLGLISVKDGILLASHSLPCQPLSPVVHGDFSNDGLMDFVVHCRSSYLGFSLDSRPGYWWTAVWIACGLGIVFIAVLFLRFIEEVIA